MGYVFEHAWWWSDRTAVIDGLSGASMTYGELRHSGAQWMITTAELFGQRAAAPAEVREVLVFGAAAGATPFAALLGEHRPAPGIEIAADDLAILPYSSGTTGVPKGVMLSHRALVASLHQTRLVHLVRPGDVVIAVLPLGHIFGMQVTMNLALHEGATLVTMPRFDAEAFLRAVQQHRVTRAEVVPPMVLARQPVGAYDTSSLRVISSGAAPMSARLARSLADRLGCQVKQVYGMTELGGATHIAPDTGRDDPQSIGPALPGVECQVLDCDTGTDLGPGEPGELLVRTPAAMHGYLNNPQASAETVDEQGWPHTGDIVLRSPAPGDELLSFVADRVSPYKKIRLLELVEKIPKSPSGKILRRVLAERDRTAVEVR